MFQKSSARRKSVLVTEAAAIRAALRRIFSYGGNPHGSRSVVHRPLAFFSRNISQYFSTYFMQFYAIFFRNIFYAFHAIFFRALTLPTVKARGFTTHWIKKTSPRKDPVGDDYNKRRMSCRFCARACCKSCVRICCRSCARTCCRFRARACCKSCVRTRAHNLLVRLFFLTLPPASL